MYASFVSAYFFACVLLYANAADDNGDPSADYDDDDSDEEKGSEYDDDRSTLSPTVGCSSWTENVPKCCQRDQIYSTRNGCVADREYRLAASGWFERFACAHMRHGVMCPHQKYTLDEKLGQLYRILSNGTLHEYDAKAPDHYESSTFHHPSNYCYEYVLEEAKPMPLICIDMANDDDDDDFVDDEADRIPPLVYGFWTSIVFLFVTLCLYLSTARLRRKTHDKCFLCHVVTLIVGFGSLSGIQLVGTDNAACTFLAYMTQFWNLASFFWLNVMCVDMWRSVAAVKSFRQSSHTSFLLYCSYAWGCPLLVFAGTFAADHLLAAHSRLRPAFGVYFCWFPKNNGNCWLDPKFVYFYSFISFTLVVNTCAFVDTARVILLHNRKWKQQRNRDSRRHEPQRKRFFLYLKLFLVMGLNWFLEVASFYTTGTEGFWKVADVANALQGVLIFVIFVCNKRVIGLLRKRFFPRRIVSDHHRQNGTISSRTRSTSTSYNNSVNSNIPLRRMSSQQSYP